MAAKLFEAYHLSSSSGEGTSAGSEVCLRSSTLLRKIVSNAING